MRERPILFQGAMVRALLAGTKTQTRRAMSIQPGDETSVTVEHFTQTVVDRYGEDQPGPEVFGAWWDDGESGLRCPYGAPGDRLWVREAFLGWYRSADQSFSHVAAFKADGYELQPGEHWKPSIHMPRAACRLVLDVMEVRIERLQDISRGDAMAEGCPFPNMADGPDPRQWYAELWDSINGATHPWSTNPWVWVIGFRRAAGEAS